MRHGTCFRRRLAAHHAAPHSAVAELGVVRRLAERFSEIVKKKLAIVAILLIPALIFLLSYLRSLVTPTGTHMLVLLPYQATRDLVAMSHDTIHGRYIAIFFAVVCGLGLLIYVVLAYFSLRRESLIAATVASAWLGLASLLWGLLILIPRSVVPTGSSTPTSLRGWTGSGLDFSNLKIE